MACFNFTEAGTTVQDTNLMKFNRYGSAQHTISIHVPCQHMSGTLILYLLHSLSVATEVMYRTSNGHHPNHTLYECYILLHSSKKTGDIASRGATTYVLVIIICDTRCNNINNINFQSRISWIWKRYQRANILIGEGKQIQRPPPETVDAKSLWWCEKLHCGPCCDLQGVQSH